MKYNQFTITVLNYGDWVIRRDGTVYFSDEETGAYWESDIAIFRDYTPDILYREFCEETCEDLEPMHYNTFKTLIEDTFKVFDL
ncbi:hypothetical protein VIPECLOM01_00060 [Enterobacter phage vB_VIPECLOM01]|nr:hypothetical protein vBEclMUFV01_170 [Enterobacter phage vB_EclM-UFV01]USL85549.1 hypothetical protein [Enterobacter phage fGh-Ecl01]WFG78492.1 hypothetical protein VIPECLOM01_00060 [Enterobacter phage vB_VIPECLOM01]WFG78780.1 hypothetical protein VIPECLUMC02_00060 [Enterobacter phage vB_VIPECLUMC02]